MHTHNFFLLHTYKPHSDIHTNTGTHVSCIIYPIGSITENKNKVSIYFIGKTRGNAKKSGKKIVRFFNFEALE